MRIVVVEDEAELAWLADHFLRDAGHEVTVAPFITEAMLDPSYWSDVDCAVVDARLPRRDGSILLAYLAGSCPHVRRVLCTASVDEREGREHAQRVLLKPYDKDEMAAAVSG